MATRRRASRSTITGNITDLQRRVRYLQAKPVPSRLANQVVTRSTIQPRAVATDQIALDAVTNDQVAEDAIKQEQIDALAVGNPEIQDDAILNRNIAANAVNNESIDLNAVGQGEMQDNSVGSNEIINGSVGQAELANNSVGSAQIQDDAVGQSEIANNAVGTAELIDLSVTNAKLAAGAVTTAKIADSQITTAKIGGQQVTTAKIADLNVGSGKLADGAVTNAKIGGGAVTSDKIANGAVTAAKILNQTITYSKVDSGFARQSLAASLSVGQGLNFSTGQIQVDWGTGTRQIPRGNHTHTVNVGSLLEGQIIRTTSGPSSSTLKVKKDIQPYKPAKIKNLLKLEPKTYRYKRSERAYHQALNKELMHGYIVEELIDLGFPEPVGYGKDGSPATLDYGLMSMLVLELVKVQQTEIDLLKEEVLRLKDAK